MIYHWRQHLRFITTSTPHGENNEQFQFMFRKISADGITEGFGLLHKFSRNPLLRLLVHKKSTATSNHPISRYSHVCTGHR